MLKGVVENDDKAWKEFYLFYKPLTGIVMRRLGIHPSEDDLNELHQRVMVELFQRGRVKKYQGAGPLPALSQADHPQQVL